MNCSLQVGLPSFPFDFPDSKAYSSFMAEEAAVSDQKVELRPPSMRPPRVPIPPPGGSVRLAVEGGLTSSGDFQASHEKISSAEMDLANSLADSDNIRNRDSVSQGQDESSFEGFIARTSNMLSTYLSEIHGGHLLLFPDEAMRKSVFSEMLNNECKVIRRSELANQILVNRKLCFLRVHLRAYKEGVFDQGAVVCAPYFSDFSLWISRYIILFLLSLTFEIYFSFAPYLFEAFEQNVVVIGFSFL